MADNSEIKLTYFNGRGLAERIRILLCYSGIEFKERFMDEGTRADFIQLIDEALIFGQVPLLEIDGLKLVQSGAIVNYLADKAGLYGKSLADKARIQILEGGCRDFQMNFMPVGFPFGPPKEEFKKACEEKHFKKYLPVFEKVLSETNTGYLFDETITVADLALFEVLLFVEEMWEVEEQPLLNYPYIQDFMIKIKEDEKLKHYLKKYRKADNFRPDFVKKVMDILRM